MESEAYLEPGFDPNTLKVAELRGILLKHDVDYPSSAKKAVLLDLFNTHVAPKASSIRSNIRGVQASSRGMIDAGFTPEKAAITRRASSRRRTRGTTEDTTEEEVGADEELELPTTRRKSTARTPRRRTVEPEARVGDQTPATVRRPRKSAARQGLETPKRVEPEKEESPETPFSSYNPFQMGSPPLVKSLESDWRKTSVGVAYQEPKKPTLPASRRRTDGVGRYSGEDYNRDALVQRRKSGRPATNGGQVVKTEPVDYSEDYGNDGLEPGEEFVPEEAQELTQEPNNNELARWIPRGHSLGSLSGNLFLVILTGLLFAYAAWWRAEKIDVGYCGVGGLDIRPSHEGNAFAELLRPECEPCPAHARCYPGLELECVDDYIRVDSFLSLGGFWPIPPTCIPDSEKERRVMIMSDAALDILRKNGAEQRCKEKFLSGDLEGVSEADLRQVLYDRKAASLSDREFSELWRHALEDVSNREEVIVETDEWVRDFECNRNGITRLKSTSLAALPPGCATRLFIAGAVAKHRVELIGMIILILAALKGRSWLVYNKTYDSKVKKLVHIALSQLAVNAINHPQRPDIAVAHLRDQVLQDEFSPKMRKHLWDGVAKVVEQNSNIRAGEREIQGEPMRVWTWIGGRFVEGKSVFDEREEQVSDSEWRRPVSRPVL